MDSDQKKAPRPRKIGKQIGDKIDRTWDHSKDSESDLTEDETILGSTPKESIIMRRTPSPSIPIPRQKDSSPEPHMIKAITLRMYPTSRGAARSTSEAAKSKSLQSETVSEVKVSENDYVSVDPNSVGDHPVRIYETSSDRTLSSSPPRLSKRLLLILDLNGVLLDREYRPLPKGTRETREDREDGFRIGAHLVWKRPFTDSFLDYCFKHFNVVVWTTVTAKNGQALVDFVFGKRVDALCGIFYQEYCDLAPAPPGADNTKPLFQKNLSIIWKENPQFSAENTLILDDSPEKLANNPPQCCFNPRSWKRTMVDDDELSNLGRVRTFLTGALLSARH
jgi:hypothetical protein